MIPRFEPPISVGEFFAAMAPTRADDVAAFEAAFAATMSQREAVAFPYGRTALIALLECLGLRDRDVIGPAYTCVVVPNAVIYSGNRPVFVDSGADANARIDRFNELVTDLTGAVIATSIFGNPVDLDQLDAFKSKNPAVPIIQDCAHSFICEWQGRPVHREGIAAIFGMNVSKTMTSIFGGMVTTDDAELAERLRRRRAEMLAPATVQKSIMRRVYALAVMAAFWPPLFWITDRLRRAGLLDRFTRYYDGEKIDMPSDYLSAMTGFEARIGRMQTGRLGSMIAARRAYDSYYREHLAEIPGLAWIDRPDGSSISHVVARVARRSAIRSEAARRGIELGEVIEYSVPEFPAYRKLQSDNRTFPVAGVLSETTINLPTTITFERGKADAVIEVLRDILRNEAPPPNLPLA